MATLTTASSRKDSTGKRLARVVGLKVSYTCLSPSPLKELSSNVCGFVSCGFWKKITILDSVGIIKEGCLVSQSLYMIVAIMLTSLCILKPAGDSFKAPTLHFSANNHRLWRLKAKQLSWFALPFVGYFLYKMPFVWLEAKLTERRMQGTSFLCKQSPDNQKISNFQFLARNYSVALAFWKWQRGSIPPVVVVVVPGQVGRRIIGPKTMMMRRTNWKQHPLIEDKVSKTKTVE